MRALYILLIALAICIAACSGDSEQVLVDAGADDALVEASTSDVMPWWDEGVGDSVVGGEGTLPPEDAAGVSDLEEHTDLDMANPD